MRRIIRVLNKIKDKPRILIWYFFLLTGYCKLAPDSLYLRLLWWSLFGKRLPLKDPQTFNEKIQWLKINDRNPMYISMVDKFDAKQYVAAQIGKEYIIPTIGVWNSFDEIDLSKLPNKFVLKCTHDSKSCIVCKDKSRFDYLSASGKLSKALKRNYYWRYREWVYKDIKPRIIAEDYIENDEVDGLHDYKVWCFGGKAKYIQYISGHIGEKTYEAFYDTDWKKQDFRYINPILQGEVPRPVHLESLISAAEKLSENMIFGRIDFYILPDDSIKFGEITFYPNSGIKEWHPAETDLRLGEMMNIPEIGK